MTLSRFQHLRRVLLAVLIVVAFAVLLLVRSAWGEEPHEAIEIIGLGLIGFGILGRLWCTLYIGGRKSAEIVENGPYSVTRNPLYVFSSVAAAGAGAQTGSIILALVFLAVCVAAFHAVIKREETYLEGEFGDAYRAYTARVPRFWPDPRLYVDQATLSISTGRLYRTFGDGLVFFLALPAFEVVEYLQNTSVIDTALRLY